MQLGKEMETVGFKILTNQTQILFIYLFSVKQCIYPCRLSVVICMTDGCITYYA